MKGFFALLRLFTLLELRSKEVSVVIFSSVLLVSVLLAMGAGSAFLDPFTTGKVFPFIFWVTIITSCSFALGRAFESEMKSGVMEVLVSSGMELRSVFFAKQIVIAVLLFAAMLMGLLVLGIIFQISMQKAVFELSLICMLLSLSYAALGNILSVVAMGSSLRAAFLPIILIPASFPLFFASLELTYIVLSVDGLSLLSSPWFSISIFLAVFYSMVGAALFPSAVKSCLN